MKLKSLGNDRHSEFHIPTSIDCQHNQIQKIELLNFIWKISSAVPTTWNDILAKGPQEEII